MSTFIMADADVVLFCSCGFYLYFFFLLFSRLLSVDPADVYHTSIRDVALVRI